MIFNKVYVAPELEENFCALAHNEDCDVTFKRLLPEPAEFAAREDLHKYTDIENWHKEHWGTGYDAQGSEYAELSCYTFYTSWTPPDKWYAELAKHIDFKAVATLSGKPQETCYYVAEGGNLRVYTLANKYEAAAIGLLAKYGEDAFVMAEREGDDAKKLAELLRNTDWKRIAPELQGTFLLL